MTDPMAEMSQAVNENMTREVTKLRNQVGTVVTVGPGNQVVVTVGSTNMTLSRLGGWSPVIGDVVLIDVSVQNWCVLGKILP